MEELDYTLLEIAFLERIPGSSRRSIAFTASKTAIA
jgi:hypothetical protein